MKQNRIVINIGRFPQRTNFTVTAPTIIYLDSAASGRDPCRQYSDEWALIQIDAEIDREER